MDWTAFWTGWLLASVVVAYVVTATGQRQAWPTWFKLVMVVVSPLGLLLVGGLAMLASGDR